jgi:hypothetical protein
MSNPVDHQAPTANTAINYAHKIFHLIYIYTHTYIIRMDLVEVGWGDADCIGLAQDRDRWRALVNSVLNFQVP